MSDTEAAEVDPIQTDLENKLDPDGEYFVGASPGDGSEARYRGPTSGTDAIANLVQWARQAFAGSEATVATADEMPETPEDEPSPAQTYTVVATVTAGGPPDAAAPEAAPKAKATRKRASSK